MVFSGKTILQENIMLREKGMTIFSLFQAILVILPGNNSFRKNS